MSAAKRLASLLSSSPRPTVEVLVAGQRFTARVRWATGFINATLIEVVIDDVSAPASALVMDEQLPLMPSEIVRRLFEEARREGLPVREEPLALPCAPSEIMRRLYREAYGVELPTPEEISQLRAAAAELARLLAR